MSRGEARAGGASFWQDFWQGLNVKITVELPDGVARHADPGREAPEALAIEGYRSGALSQYQASQLLGLSRLEFDGFLKARGVANRGAPDVSSDSGIVAG